MSDNALNPIMELMALLSTEEDKLLRSIFVQLCVQPAAVLESEILEFKGWCNSEKQLAEKASDSAACLANLGDHPKAATCYHLKSGHSE